MKKYFLIAVLTVVLANLAKAEVLVSLNFSQQASRDKVTQTQASNGWFGDATTNNLALYQLAGAATTQTYNMDLKTANRFTATNAGINISFNHFYSFIKDAQLNPLDGGTLFLGRVNNPSTDDITWTQINSYVSGANYNGSVPQLGNLNGFYGTAGSSGSPLVSTFTADTVAGADYVFRFQGGLLGSGDYWNNPAWTVDSVEVSAVPEPGTLVLGGVSMLLAGGGYGLRRWRLKKSAAKETEVAEAV